MQSNRVSAPALIATATMTLAACGGGGGGDAAQMPAPAPTSVTPATPVEPSRPGAPTVTFPSLSQPAQIDASNAKAIAAGAWVAAAPTDLLPRFLPALALFESGRLEQTRAGFEGGTVTFRTNAQRSWISLDFTDYRHGEVTFNGRAVTTGGFATSFIPYDVTVELTNLSVQVGASAMNLTGTVHQVLVDNTAWSFHLNTTSNLVAEGAGSVKTWLQNVVVERTRPTAHAYEQTYAGRVHVDDNGYVDASTDAPHAFVSNEMFPDRGGALRLTGANTSVGLVPLTPDYVAVVLDDGGDGTDDRFVREHWADLLSGTIPADTHSGAIANAGGGQVVTVGEETPLDALLSHDGDRSFLRTEWTLTVKPVGSTTALDLSKPLTPTFTPDLPGYYAFRVRAIDPDGEEAHDTVRYLATAQPEPVRYHVLMRLDRPHPVAAGQIVGLDAGMSRRAALNLDFGPEPVSHSFSLSSPFGSTAALTAITAPTSTFTPDKPGFYRVTVANNPAYPATNTKHIGVDTGIQYDEAVHLETGGRLYAEPILVDLDLDSDIDIASIGVIPATLEWAIRIFRNNGSGHFVEGPGFVLGTSVEQLLVGDIDGDGTPDLAALDEDTLHVVYRAALPSAQARQFPLSRGVTCSSISLFGTIIDANGNGVDDVLITDACEQRVTIWSHTTGGTLTVSRQQSIPALIGYPTVFGDLNHDARPDFVVPREPSFPTDPDALDVYTQKSNGDFQLSTTIETERAGFAIGEASGDTLPDLITARAPHLKVFRQTAGGTLLHTAVTHDTNSSFVSLPRFADINGDGMTDVAMTARADALVLGLQQSNGSFTFFELPEDLMQGSSNDFAFGDIDGNGILDIVRSRLSFEGAGASVRLGVP